MSQDTNNRPALEAVLADPTPYGFVFELDTVKRDGQGYPNTPLLRVVDLAKFEAAFPGVALTSLNGQSVRVSSQRIGRDLKYEKHAKDAEIQKANVEWLLGIRPTTTTVKFGGPEIEGKTKMYDTQEEASAAWLEWAAAQ